MSAGGSARSRYERGRAKHRASRGRKLAISLAFGIPPAIVAWAFTAGHGYTFGPWLAGAIVFIAFARAWVEPDYVRAWAIGSEGESVTARELERLGDAYTVLHDRRLPGSRENIDHLVIGPGGVFVVESKRMAGKLTTHDDEVFIRGRNTQMVDQVLHQAEVVAAVLRDDGFSDLLVRPILFVQKADVPLFVGRPLGVPIVASGRQLRRQITGEQGGIDATSRERAAGVLARALAPTQPEPAPPLPVRPVAPSPQPEPVLAACPRCGNEMVLRRNRQGQAFLGCSRFPYCRGTRPLREKPRS